MEKQVEWAKKVDIYQTKSLPRRLKTLKKLASEWATTEMLRRNEWVEPPTLPSFVRHQFTNYEDLLDSIERPPEDATRHDLMAWGMANMKAHDILKDKATTLSAQMLTEDYGDEWRPVSGRWSKT